MTQETETWQDYNRLLNEPSTRELIRVDGVDIQFVSGTREYRLWLKMEKWPTLDIIIADAAVNPADVLAEELACYLAHVENLRLARELVQNRVL